MYTFSHDENNCGSKTISDTSFCDHLILDIRSDTISQWGKNMGETTFTLANNHYPY